MNKGVALHSLGRLSEAVACYDEAIAIRRDLVHAQNRVELANDLANALMNKGVALDSQGRLAEAVACYDEAIAIRRDLVHAQNRVDLGQRPRLRPRRASGVALRAKPGPAGRGGKACYDQAIAILEPTLVHARGRAELANH